MVRSDIPFGNQAAQLVHAAGESAPGPVPVGTYAVALSARDESQLVAISCALSRAGIGHHRVIEGDAPHEGQLMAIGVPPCPKKVVKGVLGSLPLVGRGS